MSQPTEFVSIPNATLTSYNASNPELLNLPDLPLQAIISRIPLQPLITSIPLLHSRLTSFRQTVLSSTTRLELYIGSQWGIESMKCQSKLTIPFLNHLVDPTTGKLTNPPNSDFYRLNLQYLDYQTVKQLTSLMPAISHLEVAIAEDDIHALGHLVTLYEIWAPNLKVFKFTCGDLFSFDKFMPSEAAVALMYRRLISVIFEGFYNLEVLSLDLYGEVFYRERRREFSGDKLILPCSFQLRTSLREFAFSSEDRNATPEFLLESFGNYVDRKALKSLRLAVGDRKLDEAPAIGSQYAASSFASSFEILPATAQHIGGNRYLREFDEQLVRACPNLRSYEFVWRSDGSLGKVTEVLSFLDHLLCLQILFIADNILQSPEHWDLTDLTPLPAVKVLIITVKVLRTEANHDFLQAPYWATIFPSVQIVKLVHSRKFCTTCYPDEDEETRERVRDIGEVLPCITKFLAPLTVLPSLRKIFYQRNDCTDPIFEFTRSGDFIQEHAHIR